MFTVLKSFNDAHSAVYWLSQNRVEGASIEMTGTLKSMGIVSMPSGNYHVVLKNVPPSQEQSGGAADPKEGEDADPREGDGGAADTKQDPSQDVVPNRLGVAGTEAAVRAANDLAYDINRHFFGKKQASLSDIITKAVMDALKAGGEVDRYGVYQPGVKSPADAPHTRKERILKVSAERSDLNPENLEVDNETGEVKRYGGGNPADPGDDER